MSQIVQGYVDAASQRPCAWANGQMVCTVPDCKFSQERCILVQRERGWFDISETANSQKITHGRHCSCSACAQEDWTRIRWRSANPRNGKSTATTAPKNRPTPSPGGRLTPYRERREAGHYDPKPEWEPMLLQGDHEEVDVTAWEPIPDEADNEPNTKPAAKRKRAPSKRSTAKR